MIEPRIVSAARALALLLVASATPQAIARPPRPVRLSPAPWSVEVDPSTTELRASFDQEMDRRGASWVSAGPSFPRIDGAPRWLDDRTAVLSVRLEPGRAYWVGINGGRFTGFRNRRGEPAAPTLLPFATAARGQALTPAQNRAALAALRKAIDTRYSYRDLHKLDFSALLDALAPRLLATRSPAGFALLTSRLLGANRDLHVTVRTDSQTLPTFTPEVTPNAEGKLLHRLVPGFTKHSNLVHSGRWKEGIGYLSLTSFERDRAREVRAALDALRGLADCKALILDLRLNSGGDEVLGQELAGCFVDRPVVYAGHRLRDPSAPGGFTAVQQRTLRPNPAGPRYRGKLLVLTGPANMSSAEAFLLMMRKAGAKLVGARSYGASGNPRPHPLGNGVVVNLSSWQALLPDGTCFEGRGIAPDLAVPADPAGLAAGRDAVLARALQLLR